eukprot:gene35963-46708_t
MALIEEAVHTFQIQARKCEVTLTVTPVVSGRYYELLRDAVIDVDVNKVSQIIRNLVSNGLKFTPKNGTVNMLVDIVDEDHGGSFVKCLKVDVVDSGAGISSV